MSPLWTCRASTLSLPTPWRTGPILQDNESLVNAIENIEQYDYEHDSKLRDFCDEMAKYCDGHSCEKVLNIVLKED